MDPRTIKERIEERLPGSRAEVEGAEAHFTATIVAAAFEDKSRIERHRMIYDLFRDEMANQSIHALSLRTVTPSEWEKERGRPQR